MAYVIPHRICTDSTGDTVLLFRVRRPSQKVKLTVESNGAELASEYRERVFPGKMEKIKLKGSCLGSLTGTVKISAVSAEEG